MTEPSPYMTLDEVAAFSRHSTATVYKAAQSGQLKGTKPGPRGAKWLFHRDNVEAWLNPEAAA